MTLRDYFAAAALPEVLRSAQTADVGGGSCMYDGLGVAREAYQLADRMLEARRA